MTTIERQFLERLLQRLIRGVAQATVSTEELAKSGYDVGMFVEALNAYSFLPSQDKAFAVTLERDEIRIRRIHAKGAA